MQLVRPNVHSLTFGCVGRYIDYQRQHLALVELEALVSYTPRCTGEENPFVAHDDCDRGVAYVDERPPKVSLLLADNVAVFLLVRRVLMNLGLRYRRRLRVYVAPSPRPGCMLAAVCGSVCLWLWPCLRLTRRSHWFHPGTSRRWWCACSPCVSCCSLKECLAHWSPLGSFGCCW